MSSISESLAVASAPTNTPVQTILITLVLGIAGTMYYASPSRLTRIMVAAIASADETYFEALESGALSGATSGVRIEDITRRMSRSAHSLPAEKTTLSEIRETTLRNSLSCRAAFHQYLTGHPFTLVQCIWEVRDLQAQIEKSNCAIFMPPRRPYEESPSVVAITLPELD
ncbi:hypothetical protein GGX14DRAFT_620006 [Mycena pura]|uniref:Uncharacterized protein n=1 Tax=Mycena pura TaxID=153505 RepID=A0AAD6VHD0_9AGAR|nr:hypothetical protein GGX14DRAFT_620006 [Mycena pura]